MLKLNDLAHYFVLKQPCTMTSASPNYLCRIVIFLLLSLTVLTFSQAAASATGQQSSSSSAHSKPQSQASEPQRHHHLHSNIIPVKHLNFHGPTTDGTAKNEFDRLNNRRYYGGRVTRAQVHEAVVKTAKHSRTNEIYVMGVASLN